MAGRTAPTPVRDFTLDFGPLRRARRAEDLTQEQLAHSAGVHRVLLWRYEQNKVLNPSLKVLIALARALGVPIHDLYVVRGPAEEGR